MKAERKELLLTLALCLSPILAGILLYPRLPGQIPVHFNFSGDADGYAAKPFAVFGLPLLCAVLQAVLSLSLRADPKRANMSRFLLHLSLWITPFISVLCSAMMLATALGCNANVGTVIPSFIGLLFVVIGNYLPKTKQSYTMGIKLPWTLNSEENWNRTHRLAGFLWVLCGAAFFLFSILRLLNIYLFFALIAVMVLVPTVYSYLLYRRGT